MLTAATATYHAEVSRNPRTHRVLVAGTHTYLWRVRHMHDAGCEEILSIRRASSPSGRALHFRPGTGFVMPNGGTSASGVVGDSAGRMLNLNEPGTVRAFVDALTASVWPAADRKYLHLDGWEWFELTVHGQEARGHANP